ncbi:MAG: hypothetical protein MUC97_08305 [Bernardetiaceae bacterium]|nr:hypothetical protein [Bernardetiaceae bacterium]
MYFLAEDMEGAIYYGPNHDQQKTFKLEKGKKEYQVDANDIPSGVLIIELRNKYAVFERKKLIKMN